MEGSDRTARLEAELALSKLSDELEAAREAMHAQRGDHPTIDAEHPAMVRFKELSVQVSEARRQFRQDFPAQPPEPGDGQATPETVHGSTGVPRPGGAG